MCTENLQLGWRFSKAFSFEPVIKTPFDLLKQFAVWQLRTFNKITEMDDAAERLAYGNEPLYYRVR
ncbi:hypothetical protein YERSI8AC_290088 [Enterobacterales bacterium 8AC]|nr:hypothetical protein YERSI8AC_290088 [Enterobacterales bacterium 8AC]